MSNPRVKTILPNETFSSYEEWQDSIGLKPTYRGDGSSITTDVLVDEWIHFRRVERGIPTFTKKTLAEFVSHRQEVINSFYKTKTNE